MSDASAPSALAPKPAMTPRESVYQVIFRESEDPKAPVILGGEFTLKAVENADRHDIGVRAAALLGGASLESTEVAVVLNLRAIATATVGVVKAPDWWPKTAGGLLELDPSVVAHVAALVWRHTEDYFRDQPRPSGLDALKRRVPGGVHAASTRV